MARIRKTLTALNEVVGPIPIVGHVNGSMGVQYKSGGSGTIVLEVTLDEIDDSSPEWIGVQMRDPTDIAGTPIDNLAAAGIGIADVVSYKGVRVRKSVAGAGGVDVILIINVG
jgi:hypothetical protein